VLGYPDEMSESPAIPFRIPLKRHLHRLPKAAHQRVAAFRRYLRENARDGGEAALAAKMMGRWRSGARWPAPLHDDPEVGADPARNNAFLFAADDAIGYKTPPGSHICARTCGTRRFPASRGSIG
jgi:hypothetical protein